MTIGYSLNMEVAFAEIVNREIALMRDSNVFVFPDGSKALDDASLHNNLVHGSCALSAMCDYLEACMNTIIRVVYLDSISLEDRRKCGLDLRVAELFKEKLSLEDKIRRMVSDSRLVRDPRKDNRKLWDRVRIARDLRNELVHYKASYVSDSIVPNPEKWVLPNPLSFVDCDESKSPNKKSIGRQMTKGEMEESWASIRAFVELSAKLAGCMIKPDTSLVETDARDGFCTYIVPKEPFFELYPKGYRD